MTPPQGNRRPSRRRDPELDPEIVPGPLPQRRRLEAVFLTGATGFLGSHVLAELLARSRARVVCLVRSENDLQAEAKLSEALVRNRLGELAAELGAEKRIQPLAGDLERDYFGLPVTEFRALGRQMDAVVHCAAATNLVLPYEALRGINVAGTRTCIRLACVERRKPLEMVSSINALLSRDLSPAKRMDEDREIEDIDSILGGDPQSRWVAERLVRAAASRGLEARIYRPALVTPHTVTGARSERDAFTTLLCAMVAVGAVPDLDLDLNLVPVDFVARAIVALMRRRGPSFSRYHLVTPVPVPLSAIQQLIQRRCGVEMESLEFRTWRERALEHAQRTSNQALRAIVPGLIERIGDRTVVEALAETLAALQLGYQKTSEQLRRAKIDVPGGPELLAISLDRLMDEGLIPRPRLAG